MPDYGDIQAPKYIAHGGAEFDLQSAISALINRHVRLTEADRQPLYDAFNRFAPEYYEFKKAGHKADDTVFERSSQQYLKNLAKQYVQLQLNIA